MLKIRLICFWKTWRRGEHAPLHPPPYHNQVSPCGLRLTNPKEFSLELKIIRDKVPIPYWHVILQLCMWTSMSASSQGNPKRLQLFRITQKVNICTYVQGNYWSLVIGEGNLKILTLVQGNPKILIFVQGNPQSLPFLQGNQ